MPASKDLAAQPAAYFKLLSAFNDGTLREHTIPTPQVGRLAYELNNFLKVVRESSHPHASLAATLLVRRDKMNGQVIIQFRDSTDQATAVNESLRAIIPTADDESAFIDLLNRKAQ